MKKNLFILFSIALFTTSAIGQTNLILNGSFENSMTNWNYSSKFWVFAASPCAGASYALTADGSGLAYSSLVNEYVWQGVTIPSNPTSANLNFCYKLNTDNVGSGVLLQVWFGSTIIATYNYASSNNIWQSVSLPISNISSYAGQTIAVQFVGNESASNSYWGKVYVDNVSLIVTTCSLPSAPTGLSAIAVSSSQINVSWNSVSGATDYEVDYGLGSCPWGSWWK